MPPPPLCLLPSASQQFSQRFAEKHSTQDKLFLGALYDNIADRVERRRRRALDILSFYRSIERNNLGVNWLDIFVLLTLDVSLISPQWLILFLYDKSLISNPKL